MILNWEQWNVKMEQLSITKTTMVEILTDSMRFASSLPPDGFHNMQEGIISKKTQKILAQYHRLWSIVYSRLEILALHVHGTKSIIVFFSDLIIIRQ